MVQNIITSKVTQFLNKHPASFIPIRCRNLPFHACLTVRDMQFSQQCDEY